MKLRLSILFCAVILTGFSASAQDKLYSNEFPFGDVTLLDGPLKTARDLNLEVLMKYEVGPIR